MEQRVRICDIAEELGLSTATVSNVIHGKTNKVSDETVQRVTALLEERQYIPSMAGILLARNSSKIIGVFVNDHEKYEEHTLDDFFIASSLNFLSTEIESSGRFMMVKKAKCPDYMYLRNHMRIPFAVYDGFCEKPERILNITIDNFEGGYQMGCHFRELGHQTALCISDNNICVDMERFCGFCKGFAPGKADLLLIPMQKEQRWSFYLSNLEKFQQVTAVFAVSDYYAIDLMHFLIEQGFSVPEDISVAGFDDTPMCEMVTPTLTTIKQDGALRAKIAIRKLKELREGKEICTEVKLPVSLVVRRSTKEHK